MHSTEFQLERGSNGEALSEGATLFLRNWMWRIISFLFELVLEPELFVVGSCKWNN